MSIRCKRALYCNIGSTASLEKEMKPTVSPLINLVTGSPSLVQENHIISRFMRLSFVFICYMAVTTKVSDLARRFLIHCTDDVIVGSEREKLLQLSILSLQTHDVQRRSSSVPKNRSDEVRHYSSNSSAFLFLNVLQVLIAVFELVILW
ncbi:hypothetical protein T4A_12587 [Trichinella pseudospiralis]|uniref:Uncharacterized protein n=1 Tax=Trichinella pseudospiralis TaxID=6337 RepID=A0A0V1ER22_TRIPS|nr:hypothetical protein T4A_12587 [Trichinella pseudospiralis]